MRDSRTEERGLQVDVDDGLPVLHGKIDGRLARHASGVVHEDVDAAELFGDARERRSQGRLAGDVDGEAVICLPRAKSRGLDVEHRHVCSGALEHACGGGADAFRATGDDRSFSVEVQEIQHCRVLIGSSEIASTNA